MNKRNHKLFFNSSIFSSLVKLNNPKDVHVNNINLFREYMNLYKHKKSSSSLPGKYAKLSNFILPKIMNYNSTRNIKSRYNEYFYRNSAEETFEIQNINRLSNNDSGLFFRDSNNKVFFYNQLREIHRNYDNNNKRLNHYSSIRDISSKKNTKLRNLLICSPMPKFPINKDKKKSPNNLFQNSLIKTILSSDSCFNSAWN